MQLSDLRTEVLARGEDFLDSAGTTRQDLFINAGYTRINESEVWPWLYADATGTGTVTITDLRVPMSVVDTTHQVVLQRTDRRDVINLDPALTVTGSPQYWYRDSDTTLRIWPVAAGTALAVRYLKVPAVLSGPTDTPIIPTRYHPLIVDAAMVEAFKDSEDYNELGSLEQVFQTRLNEMRKAYLPESGPDFIQPKNSGFLTTY